MTLFANTKSLCAAFLVSAAAMAIALLPALNADAGRFFKCADAEGNTVLSQFPCAETDGTDATAVAEGNAQYARSDLRASPEQKPDSADVTETEATTNDAPTSEGVKPVEPTEPTDTSGAEGVVELSIDDITPSKQPSKPTQRAASARTP